MKVIIDRFEGSFAIVELEDMSMADMPLRLIPAGAKEGDVISITIDAGETQKRSKITKKLLDDLWAD